MAEDRQLGARMLVEQVLERRDIEAVRDDERGVEGEMGVFELEAGLRDQEGANQVELGSERRADPHWRALGRDECR